MTLLLLAAAALPIVQPPLAWEGRAVVHSEGRTIPIAVRTTIDRSGRVVSDSWPIAEGEEKGLRRLILDPATANGRLERAGRSEALPAAFVTEELAQFAFYRQLQTAIVQCDHATFERPGTSITIVHDGGVSAFRCTNNKVTRAANWVAAPGEPVRQDFQMIGYWRDGAAAFPRRLKIKRDGKLFFDLEVTSFRSAD